MVYSADSVRFTGEARQFVCSSWRGTEAVRNFCPACGSLVFGGRVGQTSEFTIYAGSLDDPTMFEPSVAIFARSRAPWATIPPGLTIFQNLPD